MPRSQERERSGRRAGRQRVRDLLARIGGAEIVAECATGREAARAVRDLAPDLVLLDVQMPDLDGFEALAEMGADAPPVVFTTAHSEHAPRAFDVRALDYLVKPFDRERLERALARVRRRGHVVFARGAERVCVVPNEIEWLRSAGNYVELHAGPRSHLVRSTLADALGRLGVAFVRVHRSSAVNAERVRTIRALPGGDAVVVLASGAELRVSRRRRAALERAVAEC